MTTSIAGKNYDQNTRDILNAILVDLDALRDAVVAITAKLDTDGGVTGTDFASTCNPAALTTAA